MVITDKDIAIIGGGPGGLTLARLLQLKGASVKVYERDYSRDVRVQGATLDLHHDSGLKALEAAGLMDDFKARYRPGADRMTITDKHANILQEDESREGEEYFRPEIDRGPLRDILLNSLQDDTVVWDSHFQSLTEQNGCFKIDFKNGTSAFADLVIGADGANSKIRPFVTDIGPFYSGLTVVEGSVYDAAHSVPQVDALLRGGKIFALGDEKTLIVSSKGDGSAQFYVAFKCEESWMHKSGVDFTKSDEVLAWFKQSYSGWSDIWTTLFEEAEPVFIPRPQYCMPLDQTWESRTNITILGDAAHVMPPFAGEGVNMAMLDALELAECLTDESFANMQHAIRVFENRMRLRMAEVGADTLKQTEALHAPNAAEYMLNMFQASEDQ